MKSKHKLSGYAIKVGDMVIGWHDGNCEYRHKPWEIGQISTIGDTVHARPKDCASCATYLSRVRRATINDFLRTLPEDIAERALRQTTSEKGKQFCGRLSDAVVDFVLWPLTEEGTEFWNEVSHGNYDRARAILAENDKDGKWAEIITPAPDKAEPQPSEFPRVMWVWDESMTNHVRATVVAYTGKRLFPYIVGDGHTNYVESFQHASDTHPVTGEPAVKKYVVEQIREVQIGVAESADLEDSTWTFEMPNGCEVSAGKFAIVPIEQWNEIKEILTQ